MKPARAAAGLADEVRAFLRAHPEFLAENPELYRVRLPPARVHGGDVEDHMAAMLAAQRAHARAMQDEAGRVVAVGRAQAGLAARVQEAVDLRNDKSPGCEAIHVLIDCQTESPDIVRPAAGGSDHATPARSVSRAAAAAASASDGGTCC